MAQVKGKLNYEKFNDFKRPYLPGLEIKDNFDNCKQDFTISLEEHYPYNFKEDGSCTVSYLCPHCEESKDAQFKVDFRLIPLKVG